MTLLTVIMSIAGAVDSTPPGLSLASAATSGATGWTGSVTTDEGNGTLHTIVSGNTTETVAAIKTFGQSQSVTATGAQSLGGTGLTPETVYYLHIVQTDAAGNESAALVSNAFTTEAVASGTGSVTATIARQTSLGVAPHYVHLNIGVSGASVSEGPITGYDDSHDGLWYHTDWGDPGAASDKVANLPAAHNDLNVSYGKYPSHCYTSPGAYTATITVREHDGTLVGTDTVSITVDDPDTSFAGSRTILLDPAGQSDAAYSGAQVVTSWSSALSALEGLGQTGRILMKRGTDLTVTSQTNIFSIYPNFYLGTYGSGARPIITVDVPNLDDFIYFPNSTNYDIVVQGIDFRGPWDSLTETGKQVNCLRSTFGSSRNMMVDDCLFDGFYNAVITEGSADAGFGLCVHNSDFTNWSDYGIGYQSQNEGGWWSILGCAAYHDENAMMGGRGKTSSPPTNRHGPIRFAYAGHMHMSACDLFSRCGWTRISGKPVAQPCFRWNTAADDNRNIRTRGVVERTAMEGGYLSAYSHHINDSDSPVYGTNLLFEKCLMVGTASALSGFETSVSGFTFRNCIQIQPNAAPVNNPFGEFFQVRTTGQSKPDDFPVRLYNNTYITLVDDTNKLWSTPGLAGNTGLLADFSAANYALYQPNASGATSEAIDVAETPMVTVGGTWTSRFKGSRWNTTLDGDTQTTLDTATATPAGSVWACIPNAGSPLLGDVSGGLIAYDDFYGNLRGANPDRGAVQR
jgi:hypothetical protein